MTPSALAPSTQPYQSSQPDSPDPTGFSITWQGRPVHQVLNDPLLLEQFPCRTLPSGKIFIQPEICRLDFRAPFAVNVPSPDWRPPQSFFPTPGPGPTLKDDPWLSDISHQPVTVQKIEAALARRRELEKEGRGDEFTFEPLVTTLENMQVFIRHIRDNKQFALPLTPLESATMAWLEDRTAVLIKEQAPYKRTVQLAMALLAACEEMTRTRILDPLEHQLPDLFTRTRCSRTASPLPLDSLMACSWGGNNPHAPQGQEAFFVQHPSRYANRILACDLNRDDILIYPSFHPLGLGDFGQFGHLPLYPIGMTLDYVCNADGIIYSPLQFALHDVQHMQQLTPIRLRPQLNGAADCSGLSLSSIRLAFRQWLLPQPQAGGPWRQWQPALDLLLFLLFHELPPGVATDHLDNGYASFTGCLKELAKARRSERAGHEKRFQQVTDTQAAMAAFWAVRLWEHCKAADFHLTPEQRQACAQQFVAAEAHRLQSHLDFIDTHRGEIRQLFAEQCEWIKCKKDSLRIRLETEADSLHQQQALVLFDSDNPDCGLRHLDNTDLAYFSALNSSSLCDEIERRTGARPPADLVFACPTRALDPDVYSFDK